MWSDEEIEAVVANPSHAALNLWLLRRFVAMEGIALIEDKDPSVAGLSEEQAHQVYKTAHAVVVRLRDALDAAGIEPTQDECFRASIITHMSSEFADARVAKLKAILEERRRTAQNN